MITATFFRVWVTPATVSSAPSSLLTLLLNPFEYQMRHQRALRGLLASVAATMSLILGPALAESLSVYGLTQQGWQIIEQSERQEARPGTAPYEHLTRMVLITEYHLVKADQKVRCQIAYDSQADMQTEVCQYL